MMSRKQKLYWSLQIIGWVLYGFFQFFLYYLSAKTVNTSMFWGIGLEVIFFIFTTHLIRYFLVNKRWLALPIPRLFLHLILVTFLFSFLNFAYLLFIKSLTVGIFKTDILIQMVLVNTLGYWAIYVLWVVCYLIFYFVEQYNRSLKTEAATKAIELQNLKSQLNPHFMFNALNSIRALVDENPTQSKNAITQLSHILRTSLASDRQRLIILEEELKIVEDYLSLESIRFEERLKVNFEIEKKTLGMLLPPLIVQTLVENGVKHGISKLKDGGQISVKTSVFGQQLLIEIRNTGQLRVAKKGERRGIGLDNTKRRLNLLYDGAAKFEILNEDESTVLTKLTIPQSEKYKLMN